MNDEAVIRKVLAEHGRLNDDAATIATDADLYAAGMTSHASVNVMLGLEDELDIEFPDEFLKRETFASIDAIASAVDTIQHS